jgi:hypothetical protein
VCRDFELTDRDLRLLAALISEETMSDVAASMGLSTRHTRRLIADLLSRMHATNTRMAIAAAVARGDIQPVASEDPEAHPDTT